MFRILISGIVLLALVRTILADEFVGPFPSWKNLKSDYAAIGDGKADDTAALQRALDDLQKHTQSNILYIPSGTYRITKTVSTKRAAHTDCMGISILGQDPATTKIVYDGPPSQIMFLYDAWYSRIGRLTLDGANKASAALAYGGGFSTYNETADMIFQNATDGLVLAAVTDNGQAENAVLRCTFRNCSGAGIRTRNFNSLDIWAWYCLFEDCGHGLYNSAGNFHAWNCVFLRSKKADIGTSNLMAFSFANNFSLNSTAFLDFQTGHSWGAQTSITGNRIIDPTGDFAIRLGSAGPFLVADNIIRNRPGNDKLPMILTWGDQLLIGNTYTVQNPVIEKGRFRRVAERIVKADAIDATPPVLPKTPPQVTRKIFEIPPTATAEIIQTAIDDAAKLNGQRPVIHLPKATYKIDKTLTIPPATDLQIIGDGAAETATVLQYTGPANSPLFLLQGPSHATLRDFSASSPTSPPIRVTNANQPNGRIFGDQVNASGGNKKGEGIRATAIDQSDILLRCFQGGDCSVWAHAIGSGKPPASQFSIVTGATGTSDRQYLVEKSAQLTVRAIYHEVSGQEPTAISLSDSGSLCIDATRFSYRTSPTTPMFILNNFRGNFTLAACLLLPVDTPPPARLQITGDGSQTNALIASCMAWANQPDITAEKMLLNQSNPPANAALLLCNLNSGKHLKNGFATVENIGTPTDEFLLKMLAPLRACRVWLPSDNAPPGTTNLRLNRLILSSAAPHACVDVCRD